MANTDIAVEQPNELNELKKVALEFVKKIEAIDNEIETLKDDKKDVVEKYRRKLDVKTLNAALRVIKIRAKVKHKDTFDAFIEALQDTTQ